MWRKTILKRDRDAIIEHLESLSDSDLVSAHNQYCQNTNNSDDEVYENDEDFFNTYFEGRRMEAIRAVCYGSYNYSDKYVKFNGYANLESFNYPNVEIDLGDIADEILESPEDFNIELEDEEEGEEFDDLDDDSDYEEEEEEDLLTTKNKKDATQN
jgi:hypothetical protein